MTGSIREYQEGFTPPQEGAAKNEAMLRKPAAEGSLTPSVR